MSCAFYLTYKNWRGDDPVSLRVTGSEDENQERQFKSQIARSSNVRQARSRRGDSSGEISNSARPQSEVNNRVGYTSEESQSLAELENQFDELLKDDQKKNRDPKKYYASIRSLREKTLKIQKETHQREDLAQRQEGQFVLFEEEYSNDPEMKIIHDLVSSDRQQIRDLLRARSQRLSKLQESQD